MFSLFKNFELSKGMENMHYNIKKTKVSDISCDFLRGKKTGQKITSLGGLEPPTFRLTAERANRLRHRDSCLWAIYKTYLTIIDYVSTVQRVIKNHPCLA